MRTVLTYLQQSDSIVGELFTRHIKAGALTYQPTLIFRGLGE